MPEINIYNNFPILNIDENYTLRQPTMSPEDIQSIYNIYNDPKVIIFVPDDCIPQGMEGAKEEARYYSNLYLFKKSIYWFVAKKDSNETIGTCGYSHWDRYNNRLELAYNIHSSHQNKGIISKAITKVVQYGFEAMRAQRIECHLDQANLASIRVLEKNNFTPDGILKQYRKYKNGGYVDVLMMSCTYPEYIKNKNKNS